MKRYGIVSVVCYVVLLCDCGNKMFYNILRKNKPIKSCIIKKKVVSLQAVVMK